METSSHDADLTSIDVATGDGATTHDVASLDARRREQAQTAGWFVASALWRRRWTLVLVPFLVGVAAVVISLQLPLWYQATARVLPPEGGDGGGLASLIGDLSPVASSLLGGGGGGDYTRYRAILTSRSTLEKVLDRFDLVEVYETEGDPFPREEALTQLAGNLSFDVDLEMQYLEIVALDQDPERAAQIANFLVAELNRRNEELALQGASGFRRYVEDQYRQIELRLDSARAEMQAFQERRGVVELPAMAQGFIESLAAQRAEVARAEIEYQALLSELGPENPQVMAAKSALDAASASQRALMSGQEALMPVPMRDLPSVANEYADVYQEVVIQQTLLETARPLLEQARFDEERDRTAVQVLDEAVAPKRKAKPKRSIIVLAAVFSSFLLTILFVLAMTIYRRHRDEWAARLRASDASAA